MEENDIENNSKISKTIHFIPVKIYTSEDLKPHPVGVLWFKL